MSSEPTVTRGCCERTDTEAGTALPGGEAGDRAWDVQTRRPGPRDEAAVPGQRLWWSRTDTVRVEDSQAELERA